MRNSVLKSVHISEKSYQKAAECRYTFLSSSIITKKEAKNIIEKTFDVKVDKINSALLNGKTKRMKNGSGRRSDRKKFTVSLKQGKKIDLFEIEKEEKNSKEK